MHKFKVGDRIKYKETQTGNLQTVLAIIKDRYVLEDKNMDIHCSTIKYIDDYCIKHINIKIGDEYRRHDNMPNCNFMVVNLFKWDRIDYVVVKKCKNIDHPFDELGTIKNCYTYILDQFPTWFNYNP